METGLFYNPALTIALALAMGMIAQALAHQLRVPGIVLLLAAGVALGPDGAKIIHPQTLGPALTMLTGFAVAVILFEGGMNLKFNRLRRARRSIRQLVLFGGLVTVTGGAVAARFILDWPWKNAILFGTLVMVTGPTVINPLLKRLKVKRSVATVLEAEGVLIDALGAVVAIVALEAALSPAHGSPMVWIWHVVSRLGFGALSGGLAAGLLVLLYRARTLVPEGSENVFTLSIVLALFQLSNTIVPESGIAAVTVAGIIVGNTRMQGIKRLVEFKEELTVLLIGMLFVLLAADVRLAQVTRLGWPGLGVVLALMFLVRPAAVFIGTAFSELAWRERLFVAWIGPRGIVAAAVASFFAAAFADRGLSGGYELRALVFLVIAVTVVFAGLTGGLMAGVLGLRRPSRMGWVILGANDVARNVAKLFKENGQEVVCIDANTDHCTAAEADCTRVIYGNGLQTRNLLRAEIDTRRGALALTANDEVNVLFTEKVKQEARGISLYAALKTDSSFTPKMLHQADVALAFGVTADIDTWTRRFKARQVFLQRWRLDTPGEAAAETLVSGGYTGRGMMIAVFLREGTLFPVGDTTRFKMGDEMLVFVFEPELSAVEKFLSDTGWTRLETRDKDDVSASVCHLAPEKK
ncbi:MAG: cation:proton antiporter [Thermodesulfobacteriota bacterium]|nr:cation:proton antiporter [Thermodesulfobacteriota bacterium]